MKRSIFTIASLLGAGFAPFSATADGETEKGITKEGSFLDNLERIVAEIRGNHEYTLAAHYSHSSHASHQSHGSHRSYLQPMPPTEIPFSPSMGVSSVDTRNENSTPLSAILPSTPATAKKLKVLPGNSEKFKDLVLQVQLALTARGYNVGSVDGQFGAQTMAAVYEYQSSSGMISSGKMTNEVLDSFGIDAQ